MAASGSSFRGGRSVDASGPRMNARATRLEDCSHRVVCKNHGLLHAGLSRSKVNGFSIEVVRSRH